MKTGSNDLCIQDYAVDSYITPKLTGPMFVTGITINTIEEASTIDYWLYFYQYHFVVGGK